MWENDKIYKIDKINKIDKYKIQNFDNKLSTFINFNSENKDDKLYDLKDYLEIIDKDNILEFDEDIYDFIDNYSNDLYDAVHVKRIKKLIKKRLEESEGLLWRKRDI